MPQSFACLNCHIVFSTKDREPSLNAELRPRIFEFIGGILRARKSPLIAAGGTEDHVHLLVSLSRELSVAETLRDIKAASSKWLHEEFKDMKSFAWQTGYGAFAVSLSQAPAVKKYLAGQEKHHHKQTFKEEFILLLKKHGIEYDERYLWD